MSLAVDFFAPEESLSGGLEDQTNIIGARFLLSAYLVKLREVWKELPTVPEPTIVGDPLSEP